MVLARKYQIKFLNIWTFSYFLGWKCYKIPWVKGPSSKQSPWIAKIWQLVWHISKMSLVLHKLNMGRLNIHCMGHCSPYSYCSVVPITRCDCRGNLPQRHIKKLLSIHEKKSKFSLSILSLKSAGWAFSYFSFLFCTNYWRPLLL